MSDILEIQTIGLDELLSVCIEWHNVGSRVSCNPPPIDTDRDILCLVADSATFAEAAIACQFVAFKGSKPANQQNIADQSQFVSFRREEVNLIVTADPKFAKLFMLATRLATRFNLASKDDRVALFQGILYGNG